jgi:cytochrome c551/c552
MSRLRLRCVIPVLAAVSLFAYSATADELDGESLLVEKRCVACHDQSRMLLGPPYIAISAMHA